MYRSAAGAWFSYRSNASRRNITFELSRDEFYNLIHAKCYYCGVEALPRNGVDRVDNSKGYQPGNVVACCGFCNRLKSDMPYTVFVQQIYRIANYQERGWTRHDEKD